MPAPFLDSLSPRDRLVERLRIAARRAGEADPFVRRTARRAVWGLAATEETAGRMRVLGCRRVSVEPQLGISTDAVGRLTALADAPPQPVRFLSIGRPEPWKGFELGLRAFAAARVPEAEYWLLANGPGRCALERVAAGLQIAERVRFIDRLPSQDDVYGLLAQCHVLVHPAMHEAFGNVVMEAMAAARPVLCLDLGGPALQVGNAGGIRVAALSPDQAVKDLGAAMVRLAGNPGLRAELGMSARARIRAEFGWERKADRIRAVYEAARGMNPNR